VETADGAAVRLRASVGDAGGARRARACGAEAVGLVRSELLGPEDGARPDAAFYRTALARLCRDAAPLPVNLRLMDIAPDKRPSWMRLPAEGAGPLGLQGARLFGVRAVRQVVEAQLEAVHDLAGEYDLGLIIPYLTRRDELEHWAAWARARVGAPVRLGAMVETPAAALDLAGWPRCADFAGLGCNDLMQCLFAADRDVPALRGFLDPCAPVLYRFLREVARSAGEHIDRVQLCGVLPQLAGVLPVLVGLGFRTFSVDAPLIPWLAEQVRGLSLPACRHLAADACRAPTGAEVAGLLGVAPSPAPRFGD
jgi:phosphoenolpyruvate-protein kinase (PTS system EI component)